MAGKGMAFAVCFLFLFYDLLMMAGSKISSFRFITVLFLESDQKFICNSPRNSGSSFRCLCRVPCLC